MDEPETICALGHVAVGTGKCMTLYRLEDYPGSVPDRPVNGHKVETLLYWRDSLDLKQVRVRLPFPREVFRFGETGFDGRLLPETSERDAMVSIRKGDVSVLIIRLSDRTVFLAHLSWGADSAVDIHGRQA